MTASVHESGEGDRATASGHSDLPDEQGITNTPAETGSNPKIETGPAKSDPDATDSGQKTAIGLAATARGRAANETSPADDALDC